MVHLWLLSYTIVLMVQPVVAKLHNSLNGYTCGSTSVVDKLHNSFKGTPVVAKLHYSGC